MEKKYFKIKRSDLIEFLRSKSKNPDYFIPKDTKCINVFNDGDDIDRGYVTISKKA